MGKKTNGIIAFCVFVGTFLLYHSIGCNYFPVDENNVLQAPNWYPIIGIWLSAAVAWISIGLKNKTANKYIRQKERTGPYSILPNIVVSRRKCFWGCAIKHTIYLDDTYIGTLKNGGTITTLIKPGGHTLKFFKDKTLELLAPLSIPNNQATVHILVNLGLMGLNLSLYTENQGITDTNHEAIRQVVKSPEIIKETHSELKESVTPSVAVLVKDRNPMDLIRLMEARFEEQYKFCYDHLLNLSDCQKMYGKTVKEFSCLELPLMAQVRFEQLCSEYREKFNITNPFVIVDAMEGHEFEHWCAKLLEQNGFTNVEVTKGSGDQGVDVLAVKDEIRYAVQCKCYSSNLGNTPVQQIHAGKTLYGCQVGVVMTNRYFTAGAKELASATGVLLWDRDKLQKMIKNRI